MNTEHLINFVQDMYQTTAFIPLHAPVFDGNELSYVSETIKSTFVSSVGSFVDQFESVTEQYTGCGKAVATTNGTAALYVALYTAGVSAGDLVITQALTFVATCNAIHHLGAAPVFVDVSSQSLGLSPKALSDFLDSEAMADERGCVHKATGKVIRAIVPMHTFGHPVQLDELVALCQKWRICLIEDAAESLGSFYKGRHTGTIADFAALSFNGNKIITTGGGGMVLCKDAAVGKRVKHITTTAKVPHPYEFYHDEIGFNYRMPNLNAALGCAQFERLPTFLQQKRRIAEHYKKFFSGSSYQFVVEPEYACSNYWLNAVRCPDKESRDLFLAQTNKAGVMTRPVWQLMHRLPMFQQAIRTDLSVSEQIEMTLVNLPSSATELA